MYKRKVSRFVSENINRSKTDFTVQTFKSGGKGGQHQNKTESGVRIIDNVTGLSSECREERDQVQNKTRAFEKLVEKLIVHYSCLEAEQEFTNDDVVRMYRVKENRVWDTRTPDKEYVLKDILRGKMETMIEDIQSNDTSD